MAKSICSVCVKSAELNLRIDTTHSKTYWAEKLGVGEASVRRHFKHGTRQIETQMDDKYKETWTGTQGEMAVVISGEEITKEAILKKFGHDPEKVSIVGVLEETHWMMAGEWQHRYRFKTTRKLDDDLTVKDLPLLYSQIMDRDASEPAVETATESGKALVVVWADIQVGKTGSRGGTPELIERVKAKRAALQTYMDENPASKAYFLSVGDEVESFENTGQQMFTNDLSFPDQLDLELTFELDMLTDLSARYADVTVAGCSSNHCRWRAGKNALGAPKDDYGIYIKKQLEKALSLSDRYDGVKFVYPETWDETVAVDVNGTKIGIAHGHQVNNPNMIESWWTKQSFGAQATAEADILLTGHFHTFRAQPMGRSLRTGKNRWWLQAPTLDNGSDWFRNLQGSDSDAGMLVFMVDENGLDLQSLTIL
jgi:hypothetical protein